jgi:hypothetical protein
MVCFENLLLNVSNMLPVFTPGLNFNEREARCECEEDPQPWMCYGFWGGIQGVLTRS